MSFTVFLSGSKADLDEIEENQMDMHYFYPSPPFTQTEEFEKWAEENWGLSSMSVTESTRITATFLKFECYSHSPNLPLGFFSYLTSRFEGLEMNGQEQDKKVPYVFESENGITTLFYDCDEVKKVEWYGEKPCEFCKEKMNSSPLTPHCAKCDRMMEKHYWRWCEQKESEVENY